MAKNVAELMVGLGLDTKDFNTSIQQVNRTIKTSEQGFKQLEKGIKGGEKSFDSYSKAVKSGERLMEQYKQKLEKLNTSYEKQGDKVTILANKKKELADKIKSTEARMKELEKTVGKNSDEYKEAEKELKQLNKEYSNCDKSISNAVNAMEKMENEIDKTEQSMKDTEKAVEGYRQELDKLNNANLNKLSNSLAKTGEKLTSIGNKMQGFSDKLKPLERGLQAVGAASVAMAIKFEENMQKVNTLLGNSGKDVNNYKDTIMKLANETGTSINDFTGSLYDAVSATGDLEGSIGLVDTANKLAKGGFTSVAKSVDILTSVINGYGLSMDESTRISDILIQSQNKGKTTVDELSSSMGAVIPTAKATGVNLENLSAMYALMTSKGIKTAESGTVIKAMLAELGKSGSVADKALRELTGKGFKQLIDSGTPVTEVLGKLGEYAEKNGKSLKDMFGSVEAGTGALILADNEGKDFNTMLKEMESSTGASQKAFDMMSDTAKEKLIKAINNMKNAFVDLGVKMLPTLTKIVEKVTSMIEKFSNMSDTSKDMIAKLVMIGAIGLPAIGLLGKGISGLGAIFTATSGLVAKFTGTVAANTTATVTNGTAVATTGLKLGKLMSVIKLVSPVALGLAAVFGVVKVAADTYSDTIESKAILSSEKYIQKLGDIDKKAGETAQKIKDITTEHAELMIDITLSKNVEETTKEVKELVSSAYKAKNEEEVKAMKKEKEMLQEAMKYADANRKQELQKEIDNVNQKLAVKEKGFKTEQQKFEEKSKKVAEGKAEWNKEELAIVNKHYADLVKAEIESQPAFLEAMQKGGVEGQKLIDVLYAENFGKTIGHLDKTYEEVKSAKQKEYEANVKAIEENDKLTAAEQALAIHNLTQKHENETNKNKEHHISKLEALRSQLGEEFNLYNIEEGRMMTAQEQNNAQFVEMNRLKNEAILGDYDLHYQLLGDKIYSFTTAEKLKMEEATKSITADFERRRANGEMSYDELRNYSSDLQKTVEAEKIKIATANEATKSSYMTAFKQSGLSMSAFEKKYGTLDTAVKKNSILVTDSTGKIRTATQKDIDAAKKKLNEFGLTYDDETGRITDSSGEIVTSNVNVLEAVQKLGKDGKGDLGKLQDAYDKSASKSTSSASKQATNATSVKTSINGMMSKVDEWNRKKMENKTVTITTRHVQTGTPSSATAGVKPWNLTNPNVEDTAISRFSVDEMARNSMDRAMMNSMRNVSNNTGTDSSLVAVLVQQNQLLTKLLAKSNDVYVNNRLELDGQVIAKSTAPYMLDSIDVGELNNRIAFEMQR